MQKQGYAGDTAFLTMACGLSVQLVEALSSRSSQVELSQTITHIQNYSARSSTAEMVEW